MATPDSVGFGGLDAILLAALRGADPVGELGELPGPVALPQSSPGSQAFPLQISQLTPAARPAGMQQILEVLQNGSSIHPGTSFGHGFSGQRGSPGYS